MTMSGRKTKPFYPGAMEMDDEYQEQKQAWAYAAERARLASTMERHSTRLKWVFRVDEIQRFLRIARLVWQRGVVGDGKGYSAKFSVALRTKPFEWFKRDARTDWCVTLFFVRLHYCRAYGGIFP